MAETNDTADDEFVIRRTVDAPRDVVWAAWTEEHRLIDWFGPEGVPIVKAALDLRPGGTFHYCMRTPDGGDMWGKWVFTEITPPEKIVLISSFSDPAGNIARAPFSGDWPMETLSTTTFTEEADGRTTITLNWSPHHATDGERKTFKDGHAGMAQGWGGTFGRLAEYVRAK